MDERSYTPGGFPVWGKYTMSFLKDGVLHKNVEAQAVEISQASDRSQLVGLAPGSIVFTTGCKNAWQLDVDGTTWVEMFTE